MRRSRQRLRRREHPKTAQRRASVAPPQQQQAEPQPHEVIAMQRAYGNRRTQALLQRATDGDKAELQQALYGLDMMLHYGPTKATVLKSVPSQYREAIQGVNVANTNRQGFAEDQAEALQALQERYAEWGLLGELLLGMYSDELVLRERIARQTKAVKYWRVAYPAIQALLSDCDAAGISTHNTRLKVDDLHHKIIDKLPELVTAQQGTLPEGVELVETYQTAKQTAAELEDWYTKSKDALGNGLKAYKARDIQLKLEGEDPLVWEGKAIKALKVLKAATDSPQAWSDAIKDIQEGKTVKGGVGVAAAAKDLLGDVVLPVANFGVSVTERLQEAKYASMGGDALEMVDDFAASAQRLNKLKSGLASLEKGLGTFGAVVDVVGGVMALSEGINTNSYEGIVGGSLSLTQGVIGAADLALGTSVGTVAAPFFVAAQIMAHIVGETVKMYGALHVADMKDALQDMVLRAKFAGESTNAFMMAAGQRDALDASGSTNPVDRDLRDSYEKLASNKAASMAHSVHRFVSSFYEGTLGNYDVIVQSFDQGVGGTGEGRRVLDQLAAFADTAKDVSGKANGTEALINLGGQLSGMLPRILTGVQYVVQTVQGVEADIQTVDFFSPDQQHDSLELSAEWEYAEGGEMKLYWHPADFSVQSPVNDKPYQQKVYDRHKGQRLDSIKGIPINIRVKVINGTAVLRVRDGELQQVVFEQADDIAYAAMGYRKLTGAGAGLDNPTAADAMAKQIAAHLLKTPLPTSADVTNN